MINHLKYFNQKVVPQKYLFKPEWIVLGVNNVCNLHCKMCDVGNKNLESNFAQNLVGTHPINMPLELIKRIIENTAKYFPKSKLAYAFTEPLVYPHLEESLMYANKKGLYTTITTNALTLKQKAEKIINGGINEIYISIDGPQEVHNEIRGHKKSFQKAIEGIEALKKSNKCPKISIISAITEWNYNQLQQLIDDLAPYDIDEFAFMHTQFIAKEAVKMHQESKWGGLYPSTDSNIDIIDFSNLNVGELYQEIEQINNKNYPFNVYFSPNIADINTLEAYYKEPHKEVGNHCGAVYTSIMIKSDGSVIPAHGRCYNLTLGNVYEQSLNDIWNSKILQKLRTDLHNAGGLFPACNRCCSAV